MVQLTRRSVLASALAAGAAGATLATIDSAPAAAVGPGGVMPMSPTSHDPIEVRWLDGAAPAALAAGTTWGVPWPRGAFSDDQSFALIASDGTPVPLQTWVTGWWPDRTVKWTAHAVADSSALTDTYQLGPGTPAEPAAAVTVESDKREVVVDTGVVRVAFATKGEEVITSIRRGSLVIAEAGKLVASRQDEPSADAPTRPRTESFTSHVERVTVEQDGPVRAVVKVEGTHRKGGRSWLPFVLRWYLYAGSDAIRLVHTFVFDGKANKDFINGLGVRFEVPMRDQLHDRHVRLAGADGGVLAEAVRPVTGLRRDPGTAVRQAQVDGVLTPPTSEWDQRVTTRLHWIPAFGDYRLSQLSARVRHPQAHQGRSVVAAPGLGHPVPGAGVRGVAVGRVRVRDAQLLAAPPDRAGDHGRVNRRRDRDRLDVVTPGRFDGPAAVPRRHGPGHVRRAARRARDHLRGL